MPCGLAASWSCSLCGIMDGWIITTDMLRSSRERLVFQGCGCVVSIVCVCVCVCVCALTTMPLSACKHTLYKQQLSQQIARLTTHKLSVNCQTIPLHCSCRSSNSFIFRTNDTFLFRTSDSFIFRTSDLLIIYRTSDFHI